MNAAQGMLAALALGGTIAALAIPDAPAENGIIGYDRLNGPPKYAEEVSGYVETVVDGDSLKLDGNRRVRLWGIDAIELHQTCEAPTEMVPCGLAGGTCRVTLGTWRCGHAAWQRLYDMIKDDRWVRCAVRDRDRYGRIVAVCSNRGGDLGRRMVARGWALDWVRYSSGAYADEQEAARAEKLGIWSGGFVPPAQWRRGER